MNLIASILLAVSQLSLVTTNDYHFLTGAPPYRITGYGCGSVTTNLVDRGEDIAFLYEAVLERNLATDILRGINDEAYSLRIEEAPRPFPQLFQYGVDAMRLFMTAWGENLAMSSDDPLACSRYDESQLISSKKIIDYTTDDKLIISNLCVNGRIPQSRSPIYLDHSTNNFSRRAIRGSQIFGLYKDLHENDALFFAHNCYATSTVERVVIDNEGIEALGYFGDRILTNTEEHVVRVYTNFNAGAINPYYLDSKDGTRLNRADYAGETLLQEYRTYSTTGTEQYLNGGNTLIRFHSFFSNKIERVKAFAAVRVYRHSFSNSAHTVAKDVIVLCPLNARRVDDHPDGGPQYSVDIQMPALALSCVDLTGVEYSSVDFDRRWPRIEYPPHPVPPPGYEYMNVYSAQSGLQEILMVRVLKIYGIAKMIYRAREIRD